MLTTNSTTESPKPLPSSAQGQEQPMSSLPVDQDLFDSRPPSRPHESEHEPANTHTDEGAPYPEPSKEAELLPPPDFKPFFTLISPSASDGEADEHVHPTVHYLFSDDDPEILTSAALGAIARTENGGQEEGEENEESEEGHAEERVVVVDVGADGKTVTNVSSLSGKWQALRTEVGAAPSMGGNEEEGGEKGLMLRISGREGGSAGERETEREGIAGDVEELVRKFREKVAGLEGVIGEADGLEKEEKE